MGALLVALLAAAAATHGPDPTGALRGDDAAQEPGTDAPEDAPADEGGESEPKQDSISLLGSRFSLVAGGAMLWPTSREVREAFGNSHPSTSIGFWSFRAPRGFGFSLDLGWRAFGRGDSGDVDIWNVSAGAVWLSRQRTRNAIPYLGLRAGPQLVKIPDRDLRLALGVTFETGLVLWRRLIVSGRYDALTRTAGLNLSNLSARIAIRVF